MIELNVVEVLDFFHQSLNVLLDVVHVVSDLVLLAQVLLP